MRHMVFGCVSFSPFDDVAVLEVRICTTMHIYVCYMILRSSYSTCNEVPVNCSVGAGWIKVWWCLPEDISQLMRHTSKSCMINLSFPYRVGTIWGRHDRRTPHQAPISHRYFRCQCYTSCFIHIDEYYVPNLFIAWKTNLARTSLQGCMQCWYLIKMYIARGTLYQTYNETNFRTETLNILVNGAWILDVFNVTLLNIHNSAHERFL